MARRALLLVLAAGGAAHGAEDLDCVGWRQTGGCSAAGVREPALDAACDHEIARGASGFCECRERGSGRAVQVALAGCGHEPFTCEDMCAKGQLEAAEEPGTCKGQRICECGLGGAHRCSCGEPDEGSRGCCNMGCGGCDELCAAWRAPAAAAPLDYEPAPMDAAPRCDAHLDCGSCVSGGCAWCISDRACRPDEAWQCQGDVDHIGLSGIGKHTACPDAADVREEKRRRRELRASAALDGAREGQCGREGDCDAADGGGTAAPDAGAKERARQHISRRSAEELKRLREEEGGGAAAAAEEQEQEGLGEVRRRAELAGESYGTTHPYETLGVAPTASSSDIRKAYRRLALKLHPDKHPAHAELAQRAFADAVAAFEILSVPDARALFDDLGGAGAAEGAEGFQSEWEFEMFGDRRQGEATFYRYHPFIANLNAAEWHRRLLRSDATLWVVEFYAPWCAHCQTFAEPYKEAAGRAAKELDGVEFAAVNCVADHAVCAELGVRAYPSVMAVNNRHGTRQEFHGAKSAAAVFDWAAGVAREWRHLFAAGAPHVLRVQGRAHFEAAVLNQDRFAAVMFADGLDCQACRTANTNLLRVAAGLAGVGEAEEARPLIALVDCEDEHNEDLCYGACDACQDLPKPPHAPVVRGYRRGAKAATPRGEALYNSNVLDQHVAMEMLERTLRLAIGVSDDRSVGGRVGGFEGPEEEEDKPPPPPPPPMWNGPEPRRAVSWEPQRRFSVGGQRQLGGR